VVALIIAEANLKRAILSSSDDQIIDAIRAGAFVDLSLDNGWTALIYGCANGNKDMVASIIELGANVNFAENDGWTPLHFAAHNGFPEIVRLLLDAGADTGFANRNGATARDLAVAGNHQAVVDMIPMLSKAPQK
jgi:ankyrin repeat protein